MDALVFYFAAGFAGYFNGNKFTLREQSCLVWAGTSIYCYAVFVNDVMDAFFNTQ